MSKVSIAKKEISKVVSLKKFYLDTNKQFKSYKEWMSMSNRMRQKNWDKSNLFVDFGSGVIGYYSDRKDLLHAKSGKGFYLRVVTPSGNSVDYKIK